MESNEQEVAVNEEASASHMQEEVSVNVFAPTWPHAKQREVIEDPSRFKTLRAGRKFRKTSLGISMLFEGALTSPLTFVYIAPSRLQAKNIAWNDHVKRLLNELKDKKVPYKVNESELYVQIQGMGRVQLLGVENEEALRGISNWGGVFCFPAGTMVATPSGDKAIESIATGDLVVTPTGNRVVKRSGKTGTSKAFTEITLSTGEVLRGTPWHKVFTDRGLVALDELRYNDRIWTKHNSPQSVSKAKRIGYKYAVGRLDITAQEAKERIISYTGKSGLTLMERFRAVWWYITLTPTSRITRLITSLSSHYLSICRSMRQNLTELKGREKTSRRQEYLRLSGTDQKQGGSGILNAVKRTGIVGLRSLRFAKNVVKTIWRDIRNEVATAHRVVGIRSLSEPEEIDVYNLDVEHDHCYYANGVLVSNCDEYDDWSSDIWPEIIRPNLMTHQGWGLIAGTPKGMRNLYKLEGNPNFKSFHFTSHDNPDLPPGELAALEEEYRQQGDDAYRQEIMAEFVKPVGLVYKEWNMENLIDFDYDPNLPLHISMDFGVNDSTSIIWLQPTAEEIRVLDYYESNEYDINHYISVIRSKPYRFPDMICGDPAGNSRTLTTGTSPIQEMAKHGLFVRSRAGVKIHEQIRKTHTFIPRMFVNRKKASRFRDILLNYRYPEKRESSMDQSNEKPIHDQWSHGARALEYWATNYSDVTAASKPKQTRVRKYDRTTGRLIS